MNVGKIIDPLTLSTIKGRLDSFNIELGERVSHQAFSFATAHLRDLGCGLLDKQERIITAGDFFPAAGGGMDVAVKGMLDWVGRDNINPDDFILGNDAFIVRWGHMADWTFVRPIFYQGELLFYHCLKTHQYDTGGAFRDAYYPGLYDSHGESLMIPPLKLMKEGKLDETVYSLILRNVRGAAMVRNDNLLVYASMKKVEDRILELIRTYGKDTVITVCDELIKRTEATVRQAISSWPSETYRAERMADWDGTIDKQVWLRLNLTIKPAEGQLIFDFSDSDPAVDYINLNLGRLWGAIVSAVAWTLPSGIPLNQGLANCITIVTKEGSVLDPVYPATTGGSVITANIAAECALIALGQAVPKSTSALWTRHMNPILVGRRRDRVDPRSGAAQAYTVMGFHSDGGNGAIYGYDGTDSYGPINAGGGLMKAPVEIEEWEAPYRWLRWEFLTDATGHGQWRGGLGTHVEILNTYPPELWHPHDCIVQTGNFEGEKSSSLGLLGGMGGAPHRLGIIRRGKKVKLRTLSAAYLEPCDIIWTKSGGGGGVGDSLDRDAKKVQWDVMNEYISNRVARTVYGVIIDPKTFAIDYKATEAMREKLRAKRVNQSSDTRAKRVIDK